MTFFFLIAFAYFIGSIPFGLLFGRLLADVDVREFGSGNIGATNVNRVLGRKLGAFTLMADVLKGLVPVVLAQILLGDPLQAAWVGVAAFIGHVFPIYLKFHGGKGVATAFGVILPIAFWSGIIGLVVWILVVRISKVSALGALVASLTIPITAFFLSNDWRLAAILLGMMAIVIYRHKENIQRMKVGKENAL